VIHFYLPTIRFYCLPVIITKLGLQKAKNCFRILKIYHRIFFLHSEPKTEDYSL
jgi:hypothetical protein